MSPDLLTRLAAALADRYRLERELGAGGMATVYLAQDLRHDRRVALKLLRPELAAVIGAERFLAEIKVTANLQHPHILPLFDSGECDGFLYYVMPFIEGETLRQRLEREKQLPIAEAVRLATEVAEALQYAHGKGVIHRDIKPENVLLQNGGALVADFGIALAASRAGGARITETGMSLGTPSYMSPEQATGAKEITPRSDVYALGAMTYEMLVGEPPFTAATTQALIAKVVTAQPEAPSVQRPRVPAHVDAAVLQALEKLPADRFASAEEFAAALRGDASARTTLVPSGHRRGAARAWDRWAAWAAAGAVGAAALFTALMIGRPRTVETPRRLPLGLTANERFLPNYSRSLDLAPDGSFMVYRGPSDSGSQLWIRRWDRAASDPLAGTSGGLDGPLNPMISPDGRRVAFFTQAPGAREGYYSLKVATLDGSEPVVTLSDSLFVWIIGDWGPDGFIYTNTYFGGLLRVPVGGGAPEGLTTVDSTKRESAHFSADVLPNGRGVIMSIWHQGWATDEIAVLDLRTREHRVLCPGRSARYAAPRHLLVVRDDGTLVALPFDADRLEVTGPAVPIVTGLTRVWGAGSEHLAVSATGDVLLSPDQGVSRTSVRVVRVSRDGTAAPVDPGWTPAPLRWPRLSPDGRRLAVTLDTGDDAQIWIKELDRGPLTRLTSEELTTLHAWAHDGRSLLYVRLSSDDAAGVYRIPADGSSAPQRLFGFSFREMLVRSLTPSPDGKSIVHVSAPRKVGGRTVDWWRGGPDSSSARLLGSDRAEFWAPSLSPDARWIAYVSSESGRSEVYVRPFPDVAAGRWQVSDAGGTEPFWSHRGGEIFYRSQAGNMVSARIVTSPAFAITERRTLFAAGRFASDDGEREYDVTPDDQQFVMLQGRADSTVQSASQIVLLEHWHALLTARQSK